MLVVTFALPDESRQFCRHWALRRVGMRDASGSGLRLQGVVHGVPVTVCHIGVGADLAAVRMGDILHSLRPEGVICAGYGGALDPQLRVGDLVLDVRHASLKAPFATPPPGVRLGSIHTAPSAAESSEEKVALHRETGAAVVDMEMSAVAAACDRAGVPLVGLRVISDEANQPLPVPMRFWFDLERQRPFPGALLGFLLRHPSRIRPFARFVSGLSSARANLARGIEDIINVTAQRTPPQAESLRRLP